MSGAPRPTHVLHFATLADLIAGYEVAVPHVVLIAGDFSRASHDELEAAAGAMLRAGAQYTCCWGDGCEALET